MFGHFFHTFLWMITSLLRQHLKKSLNKQCFGESISSSEFTWVIIYLFIGLAYQGKDIVFGFVIEYSSLRDFGP
jgi:hypothetical protein